MILEFSLMVLVTNGVLACGGGGVETTTAGVSGRRPPIRTTVPDIEPKPGIDPGNSTYEDPLDRIKAAWPGWNPPKEKLEEWQKWLDNYNAENNQTNIDYMDPNIHNEFHEDRGPGSGFPVHWADLGIGEGGVPPPPWSHAQVFTGKPKRCYLPPKNGNCPIPKPATKYAYHPYLDKCVTFEYSGCNGNSNIFRTQLHCEQVCMVPIPSGGCDLDSQIEMDEGVYRIKIDDRNI